MRDEILQPLWVHPVTRQIFVNTIGFYFLQHPSPGHMKEAKAYLGIFWGHQVLCYLLTQLLKHRLKASVEVDLRPRVSSGKVLQKVTIYWQKKEIGRTLPWDQAQVDLFQDIFALRDVAHCRPPPRRHGTIALWQIFIFWDPMTPLYKSKDTLATNLFTFSSRIKSFEISGHPCNKSSSSVIHNVFICWLSQLTTHLCNPPYHWEEPIVWWSAQNPVVFVSLRIIFAFNALKIGKKCWLTNMSAE